MLNLQKNLILYCIENQQYREKKNTFWTENAILRAIVFCFFCFFIFLACKKREKKSLWMLRTSNAKVAAGMHAWPPCQPPLPLIGNIPPMCNSSYPQALFVVVLSTSQKSIQQMKNDLKLVFCLLLSPPLQKPLLFGIIVFNIMDTFVFIFCFFFKVFDFFLFFLFLFCYLFKLIF